MFHQHIPVHQDDDVCCQSCGQVLEKNLDYSNNSSSSQSTLFSYQGLDKLMLGTSFQKIGYWQDPENKDLRNKEKVGEMLVKICKEFQINERIAYETLRRMLKANRGFYSSHKQIRELCQVIKDSENIRYIILIDKIREKYDKISDIN